MCDSPRVQWSWWSGNSRSLGFRQPRGPADSGIQQLQVPDSPKVWLSWGSGSPRCVTVPGSSYPGGLASPCVWQSRLSSSPWTSLLGAMQGPVGAKWCLQ